MKSMFWRCVLSLVFFFIAKDGFAITIAFPDSKESAGVIVHDNSLEVYQKLLAAIDSAQYYFEFCPCMAGGEILKEVLAHLDARMSQVSTLCSSMIIQPTVIDEQDKQLLIDMKTRWADRFSYMFTGCAPGSSILSPNVIEMHMKFSIVDGKYIFIGGTNFEDFMCTRGDSVPEPVDSPRLVVSGVKRPLALRDQDITIVSETLGLALRKEFYAHYSLWSFFSSKHWLNKYLDAFRSLPFPELALEQSRESYCPDIEESSDMIYTDLSNICMIISGPDESKNEITEAYVSLIDQAETSIKIANMYFIPKDEIMDSLQLACFQRKIPTEIITNGCADNSPALTSVYAWGNRMNYFFLCYGERPSLWKKYIFRKQPNAAFTVSEFSVPDTELHKKCMIIDDSIFVIGSYNFGKKSDLFDYESIVIIRCPQVAARANQVFQKDLALSQPIDSNEILQWYFDPFYHFVGHLQINFMPA